MVVVFLTSYSFHFHVSGVIHTNQQIANIRREIHIQIWDVVSC